MGKGEEEEREKSEKGQAVDGRGVFVPVFRGAKTERIGKEKKARAIRGVMSFCHYRTHPLFFSFCFFKVIICTFLLIRLTHV